jgi:hypothetical protein
MEIVSLLQNKKISKILTFGPKGSGKAQNQAMADKICSIPKNKIRVKA